MKLLITIFCFFYTTITNGQLSFDVSAGANMGKMISTYKGEKNKGLKPGVGYIIPVYVNFPVTKLLMLQTGIEFESIHHKINSTGFDENVAGVTIINSLTGKSHIEFINIPLKLFYKINRALQLGIGPFIGIGISGRNSGTLVYDVAGTSGVGFTNNYDSKIKFGSAYGELNRYNAGLALNLVYVFPKNIIMSFYSNIGLANKSHSENINSKTISLGFTMGYLFEKKRSTNE